MDASREFDAEIATRVMGWGWMRARAPQMLPAHRWLVPPNEYGDWGHVYPADMSEPPEDFWWLRLPSEYRGPHNLVPLYSTDIAAAKLVLDTMSQPGFHVRIHCAGSGMYDVEWWIGDDCIAEVDDVATLELAICRAALDGRAAMAEIAAENAAEAPSDAL